MVDKLNMTSVTGIKNQNGCLMVSGNLNFLTVPEVWQLSLPLLRDLKELRFDLEKVNSSDSAGLALLVEWMKYAKENQKKISFYHIPSQLDAIIKAAGVGMF